MPPDTERNRPRNYPEREGIRAAGPIRRVRQEDLPGIQPTLFREFDHRIAQTRLEHEPLPDAFLRSEAGGGTLVFQGQRYDLNITLFGTRPELQRPGRGSGVFVVSNGAGVAANTVDQLCSSVNIAGMIDLKQDFSEAKIAASFEMVRCVRPDLDALVINMISGLAVARDTVAAVERFCESVEGRVPVILRFTAPDPGDNEAILHSLERRHDFVTLAHSTRNLVEKTIELLAPGSAPAPAPGNSAQKVEAALSTRARLGVTLDPLAWLTPDRTLERVFGSKRTTRVGVLGFGRTARFQIGTMMDQGIRICWVATPTAAKHANPGIPGVEVFPSVRDAVAARTSSSTTPRPAACWRPPGTASRPLARRRS
jgi:hypothetical protein